MTTLPFEGVRILLLEDDDADAELARRTLRAALDCDVRVVADGPAFTRELDTFDPHLVLADYNVPGFPGSTALEATLRATPRRPFLYLSGTIGEERAVEALRTGATDYVLKGNLSRLVPAVERALRELREQREREAAQEALAESEARLRRILENAQDIVYRIELRPHRHFAYVSPALGRILGVTPEELLARTDQGAGLVHPDDRAKLWWPAGVAHDVELRVRRADGSYAWLEVRSRPALGPDGSVVATEGVVRDVTERHDAEDRLRHHATLQRALAHLGSFALAHPVEETATLVVRVLRDLLHTDVVGVFRGEGDRRVLWAGEGWRGEAPAFAYDPSLARHEGVRILSPVEEAVADSPVAALLHSEGVRTAAVERVAAGNTVLGVVVVGWKDGRELQADERALVETAANILANAVARTTAESQLRERLADLRAVDTQRRRLLGRLVSAQEEERRRIAADVHDDSIQIMTAAALRLEMLRDVITEQDTEEFDELADVVRRAIERLRTLMFGLRPPQLEREGLAAALRQYIDATSEPDGPVYELVDHLRTEPAEEARALLYRIAQEALTNVRKHAEATKVRVTITDDDDGVCLIVQDDGRGFTQDEQPHDHLGTVAMRERAELAGGRFELRSALGEGTVVTAWVPVGLSAQVALP